MCLCIDGHSSICSAYIRNGHSHRQNYCTSILEQVFIRKRKIFLVKLHITRDSKSYSLQDFSPITYPKKTALVALEAIFFMWLGYSRISKTPKHPQFGVIRFRVMEHFIGCSSIQHSSGQSIDKVSYHEYAISLKFCWQT